MSKRRRPKSVNGDRQSNREATAAGRNGQQSHTTPQGPIENVVVQGPTAMPAPVDADDQGHVTPSSLPSAAVTGSTSEPEQQILSDSFRGKGRCAEGVTLKAEQRLIGRAVRSHWIDGRRWPTHAKMSDIQRWKAEGEFTIQQKVVLALHTGLSNSDPRISQLAIKNALLAERQNQTDELAESRPAVLEQHIHNGETNNVVIILPEKGIPSEFALPSERVIDAVPSGNGHGRASP